MPPIEVNPRLLSWAPDIEPQALEQAERTSRLPFLAGHVALMPDAHWGMGATVGSVIPTRGAIVPAAVGVDIGCGMIATETTLTASDLPDTLAGLLSEVERRVPAGVGKGHDEPGDGWASFTTEVHVITQVRDDRALLRTAAAQMGSLGSGNHFVEVCLDERDTVWTVLHSGSRGIGNKLAQKHISGAKALMARYFVEMEDPDLAYLVENTPEFDAYIEAMMWAQDYAMANRQHMAAEVNAALLTSAGTGAVVRQINCHHNFTVMEQHHGKPVWLTRKGAIRAREGDHGVIPGSMGTRSYIVRGTGSKASYDSCSHGAGRRMSRGQAKRTLTVESLREVMGDRTWNADHAAALVDEHPAAYKDIDEVMENQRDLVTVEHTLRQVLNYKGQ